MDFNLETLIPIILAILFIVFGGARRRKPEQRQQPTPGGNTEADVQPEGDVVFPPFMESFDNIPDENEMPHETVKTSKAEIPTATQQEIAETPEETKPESKPEEPPPVPVDSPTRLPSRLMPITSLIDPSPETFRQGIILAEILGRPKTLRNKRR